MTHNLTIMVLYLVFIGTMVTPFVHAASYTTSTSGKAASASKASAEGPIEGTKAAAEGPAEGLGIAMKWPEGGPELVDFVIKNPYYGPPSESSSDDLPIDPTPEGSMT
jgi:hypothetical protein